ncbi:MAG TPA: hydrolase 1, exosortase A system-associated [Novosphingobium sp.]|nr:hydrolase 1, exosortase A system-associated [Novosphingobium sp.]
MTRRHLAFPCEGASLMGTLDDAAGTTGLLIVTGGNEIRAGAWNGQAQFAARIATEGFPVFRFDRRGVGDSEGENRAFRSSTPDIAAALNAFRRECPHATRIVGMGNCDAAAALMLSGGAGFDALVLSNPWTIENDDTPPPPEALRDHYRRRLADQAAIRRLLSGKVSPRRLIASLRDALRPAPPPSTLAQDIARGLVDFGRPATILLAERDRTAQAFLCTWDKSDPRVRTCPGATHSFVEPHAREWLAEEVLKVLRL